MRRVMAYDATQIGASKKFLSSIWDLASNFGGFDEVVPLHRPGDLDKLQDLRQIDHLQLWGHGRSGLFFVNGEAVDLRRIGAMTMNPNGLVWLRACAAFEGEAGHRFAVAITGWLGCDAVGHICDVNTPNFLLQSGGYALRPGESPHWTKAESGGSSWGKPNTILTTTMNVPRSWYQPVRSTIRRRA